MSDIKKEVDRGVPSNERTQLFTQADAGASDIILVKDTLGRKAKRVTVDAIAAMSVRFNVYQTNAPRRLGNDLMFTNHLPNLALSNQYKESSMAAIPVDAGETLVMDMPIGDIEIVTCSGDFRILVQ